MTLPMAVEIDRCQILALQTWNKRLNHPVFQRNINQHDSDENKTQKASDEKKML